MMFHRITKPIYNFFFVGPISRTLDDAIAISRQDDGSLQFTDRGFFKLPSHERETYLRMIQAERSAIRS